MDTRLSIGELKKMALFPAHILKLQPVLNIPLCHVSCLTNFGLISSAVLTFSGFKQTNKQMSKLYKQSEKEFRNKFSVNRDFLEQYSETFWNFGKGSGNFPFTDKKLLQN